MRATLNLDTQIEGNYITDMMLSLIDKKIQYCESNEYTLRRCGILVDNLNEMQVLMRDILQYYHYFIRPDFSQKPDVDIATEGYKEIADKATIEQLKSILGKNHSIDFNTLGSSRIEIKQQEQLEVDSVEEDIEGDGEAD